MNQKQFEWNEFSPVAERKLGLQLKRSVKELKCQGGCLLQVETFLLLEIFGDVVSSEMWYSFPE